MPDQIPSSAGASNEESRANPLSSSPDSAGPGDVASRDAEPAPIPSSRRAARQAAVAHEPAPGVTEGTAGTSASSLDDLFSSDRDDPGARTQPRKKRRKGCAIALVVMLVLLGGVAAAGVYAWSVFGDRISDVMGWGEPKDYEEGFATGEALVTIAEGDTGAQVSTALYLAEVTKTERVFYDMLIKEDLSPTFFPGVYRLQQKMTASAALEALRDPANKLENSALIREGLSISAILPILSEGLDIPLSDFESAVADPAAFGVTTASLEGWLFPAFYEFEPNVTASEVIQKMVDRTRQSLANAGVAPEDEHRILTVASIIQREARYEEDFFKVSRVIQNRLGPDNEETGGRLEMDSTVQYGFGQLHSGAASTSEEARNDDNPWNTYMYAGLPQGPIASPGDLAIEAAMKPAEGPWFYFVTVNMDTGETIFTKTYDEHLGYVEQMQKWCEAHPDSGC